jgi:hypothetical protein
MGDQNTDPTFQAGDAVEKVGGDYRYAGVVVGVVVKRSGQVRYVVEDDRGLLFIFNGRQLRLAGAGFDPPPDPTAPVPEAVQLAVAVLRNPHDLGACAALADKVTESLNARSPGR